MKMGEVVVHHKLFIFFLALFVFVGSVDLFNLDRFAYKALCDVIAPVSGSPCPPFYDIPIWHVYLSLAILAALYHVHDQVRTTNRHLSSRK